MKANTITIGIVAIGAFLLLRQRTATAQQTAVKNGAQTYSTPTSVAAMLGAFVSAYTKQVTPSVRVDNVVGFDWKPYAGSAVYDWGSPAALAPTALGQFNWLTNGGADPADQAWKPLVSYVNSPGNGAGSAVDSTPAGAVYTLSDDFMLNPFQP